MPIHDCYSPGTMLVDSSSMKKRNLATFLVLLIACPVHASESPWPARQPRGNSRALQPLNSTLLSQSDEPSLPLECRGYYVRKMHLKKGGISRCE
jgi:hypothetical protein